MKSGFFPKTDEIILTIVTALVVAGLIYQGVCALSQAKEESLKFQKSGIKTFNSN